MFRKAEIVLWVLVLIAHVLLPTLGARFEDNLFSIVIFWTVGLSYVIGSAWFFQKKGSPKKLILPALLAGFTLLFIFFVTPLSFVFNTPLAAKPLRIVLVISGLIPLSWLIGFFIYRRHKTPLVPLILKTSLLSIWSSLVMLVPIGTSTGYAIQSFYQQGSKFDTKAKMLRAYSESNTLSKKGDKEGAYLEAKIAVKHGYDLIEVDSNWLDFFTHHNYGLKENTTDKESTSFTYESLRNVDSNYMNICDIYKTLINFCNKSINWAEVLADQGQEKEAYTIYYQTLVHFEALKNDRCLEPSTYYINVFKAVRPCVTLLKKTRGQSSADSFLKRFQGFHIYEKTPGRTPNPMFLFQTGSTYRSIYMKEKALDCFNQVIENSDDYTERIERIAMASACYEKAELLMLKQDYKAANESLDLGHPFLVEDENKYHVAMLRASIAYRQKDYEKAETLAKESITMAESFQLGTLVASSHKMLADIYIQREDIDRVMEQREQLAVFAKTNPSLETKVAEIDVDLLKLNGHLYEAYELMKNKKALFQHGYYYYFDLSDMEYDLMFYDRAYSNFKSYMAEDTSYAELSIPKKLYAVALLTTRNRLYQGKQLILQTEKDIAKWRSPNSFEISLRNAQGIHAGASGQLVEAETYFSEAVILQDSLDAKDVKSLIRLKNNLAKSQLKLGKTNQALKNLLECQLYIKGLRVQEILEAAKTYRLMAECYTELNELNKARNLQKKAARIYESLLPQNHPIFAALREV